MRGLPLCGLPCTAKAPRNLWQGLGLIKQKAIGTQTPYADAEVCRPVGLACSSSLEANLYAVICALSQCYSFVLLSWST